MSTRDSFEHKNNYRRLQQDSVYVTASREVKDYPYSDVDVHSATALKATLGHTGTGDDKLAYLTLDLQSSPNDNDQQKVSITFFADDDEASAQYEAIATLINAAVRLPK